MGTNARANHWPKALGAIAALAAAGGAHDARAQTAGNPTYQSFFRNTVCTQVQVPQFLAICGQTFIGGDPNNAANYADISAASESSLTPSQAAVAARNSVANARAIADATEARLEALRDEEDGKPTAQTSSEIAGFGPWSVFANIDGEWFDRSARNAPDNAQRGFDGDRYGGTLGADYRIGPGSRVGLMLSYSKYSLNFDRDFASQADAGGTRSKTVSVTAFAAFSLSENGWLDIAGGMGWSDNDFRRNGVFQPSRPIVPVANTDINAFGSADGKQWFLSAGAGYDFVDGPLSIGPYLRARYTHSKIDGYVERERGTTTGLIMAIPEQESSSFTGILGGRVSYAISTSWGVIVPQGRLEFEHEFDDDVETIITRFVLDPSGTQLPITSVGLDRDHVNAGLSLAFILPGGVVTYVDYEGLIGYSDFKRHRVSAGLRLEF